MKLNKETKRTVKEGDFLRFRNGDVERVTTIYEYKNGGLAFTLQDEHGRMIYLCPASELYGAEILKPWQIRKPEAFYTGGGIWLSAMYISEHYYIVTDNDTYDDGFCIYDDRQDDEIGAFCCQGYIGEKLAWSFDEQDWNDFMALRIALNKAMY